MGILIAWSHMSECTTTQPSCYAMYEVLISGNVVKLPAPSLCERSLSDSVR